MKQHILMLVMGLCAGLVLAGNLAVGQGQDEPVAQSWPPEPGRQIVNENGLAGFAKKGRQEVIYSVPEDSWLVITDFRTIKKLKELYPEPDLLNRKEGAKKGSLVLPWQLSAPSFNSNMGSAIGLKFEPGSDVVLQRSRAGTTSMSCYYFFAGYLTPAR